MALTLGRAGKTLALPEPSLWDNQNGRVTVRGSFQLSPVTDSLRLRDQLLGYQDNWDEPIVPVVVGSEPRLTGYYRVLGVYISTDVEALNSGWVRYEMALQQVMGFTQPLFESIISGSLLTNAVGAVLADVMGFHTVPTIPGTGADYSEQPVTNNYSARTSADGSVDFYYSPSALSGSAHSMCPPVNFYTGAATFEQGSPLQPVVGRGLAQPDLVNWRLSNGLVRVTWVSSSILGVSHYNGSTWSAVKQYAFSSPAVGPTSISILRNSVEETTMRMSAVAGGNNTLNVDISLRRGDRIVRIYMSSSFSITPKIARGTAEAATAITYGAVTLGGFRATANDGDGNRYVLLSYQSAATSDLVNGALTRGASGTSFDIGIGSEIGGSGATVPNRAVDIAQQYLAAQSESQRIVSR
jgi:hypothetical protein